MLRCARAPLRTVPFLLLLTVCVLGAHGQIAPGTDDPAPVVYAPTPTGNDRATASGTVQAFLLGWSTGDETTLTKATPGDTVSLQPERPEAAFFFRADPTSAAAEFRYRLDGYDPTWTVTRDHVAHYRRLPPGSYTFQVQARLPGQPWPRFAATLHVQQKPFFYQSWYAYVLVGVVLLGIAIQILQQRDQLLKGQMAMVLQERNRIASECHDTLMAGFAAISWQLEATSRLFRERMGSDDAAAQSCELARSMVAHCQAEARRIIWDLRESDEITNSLSHALLDATAVHRERESPQTTVEVQGTEVAISPGAVHHLVCIGQEAVTNAIRHGAPSTIRICLRYEAELLRLTVHDNGRGFQPSDRSARAGHFGIPVMEERARKLGGSLHLLSSATGGTEVSVTVGFHGIQQLAAQQQHIVKWIGV
ncbi:MAG: ATP-binding protein [Janthinobacterium lividum]